MAQEIEQIKAKAVELFVEGEENLEECDVDED